MKFRALRLAPLALMLALLAPVGSLAAPPVSCYVEPSTVLVGQPVTVHGSGFHANVAVTIYWYTLDTAWFESYPATSDGNGDVVATEDEGSPVSGPAAVEIFRFVPPGRTSAQCFFTVAP